MLTSLFNCADVVFSCAVNVSRLLSVLFIAGFAKIVFSDVSIESTFGNIASICGIILPTSSIAPASSTPFRVVPGSIVPLPLPMTMQMVLPPISLLCICA